MTYLDVSPMMVALRTTPEEFEIEHGWLRHIPSRHDFMFDPGGKVQIRAQCNCSSLSVRPDQSQELASSYKEWQTNYWKPLLINREFASHFHRSAFRRVLIDLVARLHRQLLEQRHGNHHAGKIGAMHPAE